MQYQSCASACGSECACAWAFVHVGKIFTYCVCSVFHGTTGVESSNLLYITSDTDLLKAMVRIGT